MYATDSLMIEALAILRGLLAIEEDNIILETDSLKLVNIILQKERIPWSIFAEIGQIKDLIEKKKVEIIHTYRGGNAAADFFSKTGIEHHHYEF